MPLRKGRRCYIHHVPKYIGPAEPCGFSDCDRRATWKGLCQPHGKQRRRGQTLRPLRGRSYDPVCTFQGCDRPHLSKGLCSTHYEQRRQGRELKPIMKDGRSAKRPRPQCLYDGCDRIAKGYSGVNRYCGGHFDQLNRGVELRPLFAGRGSVGHVNAQGYRVISVAGVPALEHRAVMELDIGRPLREFENVHHLNGDRLDNRVENLELWVNRQPRGQRVSDLIEFVIHHYRDQLMARLEQERGT